jgi:starch synthase
VSSECAPLAKLGGLGDAVAGLVGALRELGHEVRVMLPLYAAIDRRRFNLEFLSSCCVHMGSGEENWVGIWRCALPSGVECRLVDYERFYGRAGIYDENGEAYGDNGWRFALLCKAALQHCKDSQWIPDVVHSHDWSAGLCGLFLKTWDRILSPLSGVKTVFTIHNIGYQGKCHPSLLRYIGVGGEHFSAEGFEDHGAVNLLKAGINYADAVTTVSPTHAKELLTSEGGHGMGPYLQRLHDAGRFCGILNGVEDREWNPAEDRLIADRYDVEDPSGKKVCKKALQMELGLRPDDNVPLMGCVTRLVRQKGVDLMRGALHRVLTGMNLQLALLGSGERDAENFFRWLGWEFPGRVAVRIGFSNELAHAIYAGSDLFLMPSLYEPCGLGQLYAMRYGSVPIVRSTGGLADTVEKYVEQTGEGSGFVFDDPTPGALHDTIGWAVSTWYDRRAHFDKLRASGMRKRFPWTETARQYVDIYRKIT